MFIGVGVLLASCAKDKSSNVNQDSIYSIYELNYNASTDKTVARATFRFGGPTGTLLELEDPAVARFNGDQLLYSALLGSHSKEYAGFTNSGTFTYVDVDNNTFTNASSTLVPIGAPSLTTLSNANAYTYTWTGAPIAANETVTLTIDGTQQNNIEIISSSQVGATELIIPASKLQNIGLGTATFLLVRSHNRLTVDQGTTEGGRMATNYSVIHSVDITN